MRHNCSSDPPDHRCARGSYRIFPRRFHHRTLPETRLSAPNRQPENKQRKEPNWQRFFLCALVLLPSKEMMPVAQAPHAKPQRLLLHPLIQKIPDAVATGRRRSWIVEDVVFRVWTEVQSDPIIASQG